MEQLPSWLQEQHSVLQRAFALSTEGTFSWHEALTALSVPEGTVARILSSLERAGYLYKEADTIDQRMRIYRLVDIESAQRLDQKLEDWRQRSSQLKPVLAEIIDNLWSQCRAALSEQVDLSHAPVSPGQLTLQCAAGTAKLGGLRIEKATNLGHLAKATQGHASELLKLFDASSNAYRSLTNVLLEYEKLRRDLANRVYDLPVTNYAAIDGAPLQSIEVIPNKALCPVCRRFRQSQPALALITGNPKMDSVFQAYRNSQDKRPSIQICGYCFLAGWVDLPTAFITKDGQSVSKGREYLFITTPLAQNDLKRLLDTIARQDANWNAADNEPEEVSAVDDSSGQREEPTKSDEFSVAALGQFLKEKYGIEGYDAFSVLGVSRKRLRELQGFVLSSANLMERIVAVRVPVERLVGEDQVSGAVRRELVKATMYDFWRVTGGALHYNRVVSDAPFSVEGQPVTLEEMHRANVAYHLANRYARAGKKQQLSSGAFMLLLTQPRVAANNILRAKHRVRKYAPGETKVKEVIELTESIAFPDWKFGLGLRIVGTLVDAGLLLKAEGFRKGPGPDDVYSGVDLIKWLQRLKMIHDETTARAWGNMLLNALKRGDLAYKDYIQRQGGQINAPGKETIRKILDLVDGPDGIIQTCAAHNEDLRDLSRDLANMDYYLLFYYNQRQAAQKEQAK